MARQSNHTVFDEYLPPGTNSSSNAVFTGAQNNAQLGKHNRLGIMAVLDNIQPAGTNTKNLLIFVEVSADGRTWVQRSNQANAYANAEADLTLVVAPSTKITQAIWSDACQGISKGTGTVNVGGPLLGFVRLRCFFDDPALAGHLKIHVTQHD